MSDIMHDRAVKPLVVIVGAGFAGLKAAQGLEHAAVDILLVDKQNHHTFQPLLYQVATGTLSPSEIAQPVRSIVQDQLNLRFMQNTVSSIDTRKKIIGFTDGAHVRYDYLILAAGAGQSYFGHDDWSHFAPGLKTLDDALEIRERILDAFETAEKHALETWVIPKMTIAIIGGGPTGVELAGAISETCRNSLSGDFRLIEPADTRVVLIEATDKILGPYSPDLTAQAMRQLGEAGVEVQLQTRVLDVGQGYITTTAGRLDTPIVIWTAGVAASPLGSMLGTPLDRTGRVVVDAHLNPPYLSDVFVCGDLAHIESHGAPLPGVAQVAMQTGRHAAREIISDLAGELRTTFSYFDKGDMVTIGRFKAIADVHWPFRLALAGASAWWLWLMVHLAFLNDMRNRLAVLCSWIWTFVTQKRTDLLIVKGDRV